MAISTEQEGKQQTKKPKKNSLLDLHGFLDGLLADDRINQTDYDFAISSYRSVAGKDKHILHSLADLKLDDRQSAGAKLTLESLTMALSTQCGQEYYRIDPLKIDVAKVTQGMSGMPRNWLQGSGGNL